MSQEANSDPQELLQVADEQSEVAEQRNRAASLAKLEKFFCDVVGDKDWMLVQRLVSQAGRAQVGEAFDGDPERFVGAASMLGGLQPTNATEALLAVQMVAVHHAALMFLNRATSQTQGREANVLQVTRLMRLFNEQLQAMSKLKGKAGQQKVTVEHVHVHKGGQAIVGAVSTANRGLGDGIE